MWTEGAHVLDLTEKSPCDGALPIAVNGTALSEVDLGPLTLLSPWRDRERGMGDALKAAHGVTWPDVGRATGGRAVDRQNNRAIWFGLGQVLLAGPTPQADLADHGAMVDQSDAWTCLQLDGDNSADVLARLVPVDMRATVFKRGHTARTELGHVQVSVTRLSNTAFLILGPRSMAGSLVHDLRCAIKDVMEDLMVAAAARG
jgi:sarcosine oxidase subunit gamma